MAVGEFLIRPVDGDSPYQAAKEGDVIKNPGAISGNNITVTNTDSPYTAQLGDQIILVDESGGAVTVTLPAPTWEGESYTIKQITGGANNTTVDTAGSETIDGASSIALDAQWEVVKVVSDGTDWLIVSDNR